MRLIDRPSDVVGRLCPRASKLPGLRLVSARSMLEMVTRQAHDDGKKTCVRLAGTVYYVAERDADESELMAKYGRSSMTIAHLMTALLCGTVFVSPRLGTLSGDDTAGATHKSTEAESGDAALLAENRIEPTRPGLTAFLRRLRSELEQMKKAESLISQLGDASFRVREDAMRGLLEGPALPLKALQQASADPDLEIAYRAKQILSHAQTQAKLVRAESLPQIGAAVCRTIEHKRITGVAPELFDLIGLLDDREFLDAASEAAAASAGPDDALLLERSHSSKHLNVRIAALRAMAGAKLNADAELRTLAELRGLLEDKEPRLALAAAHTLAQRGERSALASLVRLAAASDEQVRARSIQILRAWTDREFGFNPFQDPTAQQESLARWHTWVAAEGKTAELNLPLRLVPLPEDLRRGLLLHYTFDQDRDGRLTDTSGHKRHGSLHNANSLVAGTKGKALELRGQGSMGDQGGHALLPFIDFMALKQFTVALWVNERAMSNSEGEAYVVFGADRTVVLDDSLGISHFNNDMVYRVGGAVVQTAFDKADLNRWVHYALTFQGGRLRAYKNGRIVGEAKGAVSVVGKQAALGRHWWHHGAATSTRFIGSIDELRIYERALLPAQMELLHASR
jgi:hypothetical protein